MLTPPARLALQDRVQAKAHCLESGLALFVHQFHHSIAHFANVEAAGCQPRSVFFSDGCQAQAEPQLDEGHLQQHFLGVSR